MHVAVDRTFFVHVHVRCFSSATLDGGVGYLLPIPEKTYRRLLMLQIKLVQGLPHTAGLNPKAFRLEHKYTPLIQVHVGQ